MQISLRADRTKIFNVIELLAKAKDSKHVEIHSLLKYKVLLLVYLYLYIYSFMQHSSPSFHKALNYSINFIPFSRTVYHIDFIAIYFLKVFWLFNLHNYNVCSNYLYHHINFEVATQRKDLSKLVWLF